nr:hypothetical protein GW17_00050212 [Ipomoea batatas]
MVPSDRVSDKSQRLVPNDVQELERVKHGHVAPVGLPPPLHEPIVRPPVFHAVLVLVDRPTRVIGVIRAIRVGHPFPGENVAPLAVRLDLDLLLLPPVERRRHLLRRVEGGEIWIFIIERPENRDQRCPSGLNSIACVTSNSLNLVPFCLATSSAILNSSLWMSYESNLNSLRAESFLLNGTVLTHSPPWSQGPCSKC